MGHEEDEKYGFWGAKDQDQKVITAKSGKLAGQREEEKESSSVR